MTATGFLLVLDTGTLLAVARHTLDHYTDELERLPTDDVRRAYGLAHHAHALTGRLANDLKATLEKRERPAYPRLRTAAPPGGTP